MKKFLLAILLIITSCTGTWDGVKTDSKKIRGKVAEKIYPEGKEQIKPQTEPEMPYCYSTIADPVCYDKPQTGEEYRLIK